jgi:hypothetical protein
MACVHVLGLQEGRAGIEDLPMLTSLKQLLPDLVEVHEVFIKIYYILENNNFAFFTINFFIIFIK